MLSLPTSAASSVLEKFRSKNSIGQHVGWRKEWPKRNVKTAHGLRKTRAVQLAEAGCTAHQIIAITGHRSLSEIHRCYTQAVQRRKLADEALAKLGT
jgi:integrase